MRVTGFIIAAPVENLHNPLHCLLQHLALIVSSTTTGEWSILTKQVIDTKILNYEPILSCIPYPKHGRRHRRHTCRPVNHRYRGLAPRGGISLWWKSRLPHFICSGCCLRPLLQRKLFFQKVQKFQKFRIFLRPIFCYLPDFPGGGGCKYIYHVLYLVYIIYICEFAVWL